MKKEKRKLLYLGNMLSGKGVTTTTIETLSSLLLEKFRVLAYSRKKNKFARLFDVLWAVWVHRKDTNIILLDTYSTSNFIMSYSAAKMAKWLNIPYIPNLHGGDLPKKMKKNSVHLKRYLDNAEKIVAPSNYLRTSFERFGYEVEMIPNVLDLGLYHFKNREKINAYLLFVRSLHQIYNPQLAIEVLAGLKREYPDAKLCMVGPDKDNSLPGCKALAKKLQVEDSVEFTGILSKEAWIKRSEEFDIFINTTNVDNTPVSVIEAMALGLPVVSTNVGGIPHLLNDERDALLVERGNAKEMINAVKRLINQPELVKSITNNARVKAASFDWEEVKHQWFKLFEGVA